MTNIPAQLNLSSQRGPIPKWMRWTRYIDPDHEPGQLSVSPHPRTENLGGTMQSFELDGLGVHKNDQCAPTNGLIINRSCNRSWGEQVGAGSSI